AYLRGRWIIENPFLDVLLTFPSGGSSFDAGTCRRCGVIGEESSPSEPRRACDSAFRWSFAQASTELGNTPPPARLVLAGNLLGVLARLDGVHPGCAVHSGSGNQASVTYAVHGSQPRNSIWRLRGRIQIRYPGESGSSSGFILVAQGLPKVMRIRAEIDFMTE